MSDAIPLLIIMIMTLVLIFCMFFVGGVIALASRGLRFAIYTYFVAWLANRINKKKDNHGSS